VKAVFTQVHLGKIVLDMEARSLIQYVTLTENSTGKAVEDLFGVYELTIDTIR